MGGCDSKLHRSGRAMMFQNCLEFARALDQYFSVHLDCFPCYRMRHLYKSGGSVYLLWGYAFADVVQFHIVVCCRLTKVTCSHNHVVFEVACWLEEQVQSAVFALKQKPNHL